MYSYSTRISNSNGGEATTTGERSHLLVKFELDSRHCHKVTHKQYFVQLILVCSWGAMNDKIVFLAIDIALINLANWISDINYFYDHNIMLVGKLPVHIIIHDHDCVHVDHSYVMHNLILNLELK